MPTRLKAPGAIPIVNVASVPKRSLFRYPGGKTWLIPLVRKWLLGKSPRSVELIEPFAGGAIVGLTAAFEQLAQTVTLVEKDPDVAAVWRTIFNAREGSWLADRIAEFKFSPEAVRAALEVPGSALSVRERAFQTIVRNRVQRGGILAAGAGIMRAGENGHGMASRWYPETLKKRILDLSNSRVLSNVTFIEGDGLAVLRDNASRPGVSFFIDPPYTVAGRRLYTFSEVDHEELFRIANGVAGDFLMTYDNVEAVLNLASTFGFQTRLVAMKNTHHSQMTELLIGRNLDWLEDDLEGDQPFLGFGAQTIPC